MSVDDYIKRGRSQMLQLVSHGEIFSVSNEALAGDRPQFTVQDAVAPPVGAPRSPASSPRPR